MVSQEGKGTWCVDMPKYSARGWKPQICGSSMVNCEGQLSVMVSSKESSKLT
jgi:hypothetical protein